METREDAEARHEAMREVRALQERASAAQAKANADLGSGRRVTVPSVQRLDDDHVVRVRLDNQHKQLIRRVEGEFVAQHRRRPSKAERRKIRDAAAESIARMRRREAGIDGAP